MQHSQDNKNLLLAIVLSVVVMVGWNYLYGVPQAEKARQAAQQGQTQQQVPGAAPAIPGQGAAPSPPGQPTATPAPAGQKSRAEAVSATGRIAIDTPALKGSISLKGARFDDLSFQKYRESVTPGSPNINLFSPADAPDGYYADFGWVPPTGSAIGAPNSETLWTSSSTALAPGQPATLTYDNGQGLVFTRTISVDDKYMFTIADRVENRGSQPQSVSPYGRISRIGAPKTEGIYVLHEGLIGFLGDQRLNELTYADMDKQKVKNFKGVTGGWLGFTDKYWAAAIVPTQDKTFDAAFGATAGKPSVYETVSVQPAVTIAPGAATENTLKLFAGAKEVETIDAYKDSQSILMFDKMIDWGWFYWLTKPLFTVINYFNHLFHNFGVAILIVTVLVKLLFYPLANKSYRSMAMMKEAQPEMMAIKERNPDDRVKQQQEMMELYKKKKINPMAGCLPVLLQIPVFFALYKVIYITIEMRQAPFFGWIRDLSAPDPTTVFNLFGLLPYTVPNVSFLHLGVWPIVMGITMWLQMKMNPEPPDPVQKQIFAWMPLVFTFMLAAFPAGLVIYWAWNNFLSIVQQYIINRQLGVKVELWDNLRKTFRPGSKPAA